MNLIYLSKFLRTSSLITMVSLYLMRNFEILHQSGCKFPKPTECVIVTLVILIGMHLNMSFFVYLCLYKNVCSDLLTICKSWIVFLLTFGFFKWFKDKAVDNAICNFFSSFFILLMYLLKLLVL